MNEYVYASSHMCAGAHKEKRRKSDPLELELHTAMNLLVLGTELQSSARAVLFTAEWSPQLSPLLHYT